MKPALPHPLDGHRQRFSDRPRSGLMGKLGPVMCLLAAISAIVPINAHATEDKPLRIALRIPSQPLDGALLSLAQQANVQLAAAGDLDLARRSGEVSGVMSVDTALTRLLSGTGYSHQLRADGVVIVMQTSRRAPSIPQHASVVAPDVTDLSRVVVTARRRDERWIDVPMAVSVWGGTDLERLGVNNVAGAVGLVPGVTAIDAGAAFTQVQIRGVSSSLGGNDNGYYLDDIPFTGVTVPWHPDTRIYDADSVEVLKGPQGTLFGEGSMGGTIRVVTNAPNLQRREGSAQLGVNSTHGGGIGGEAQAMLNLPLVDDALAVRVVASREVLPGWVDTPDGGRDVNQQRITTQRFRLRWVPDDRWMTDVNLTHRATDAPGGDYAADDFLQASLRLAAMSRWQSAAISSHYFLGTSKVSLLRSDSKLVTDLDGSVTPTDNLRARVDISVDSTELRWASTEGRVLDWQLGMVQRVAHRRDLFDVGGELTDERTRSLASAVFGEATLRPAGTGWAITTGLRYFEEDIRSNSQTPSGTYNTQASSSRLIPRLSVGWHPSGTGLIYASVATGFRSGQIQPATASELAAANGIDVPAYIKPDILLSYELGLKQLLADGRMRLQGSLFRSRWTKLPVRVPINDIYNALTNSGGASIRGAELEARYVLDESLDMGMGLTYTDAHYTADVPGTDIRRCVEVYNVPKVSISATTRYAWRMQGRTASVAGAMRYHTARQTGLLGRPYSGDAIFSVDVRFGVEDLNWGWFVYGNNLTNEDGALDGRTTFGQATRLHPRSVGIEVQYRF